MTLMTGVELLKRVRDGARFVADGAMGTELMKRGVPSNRILAANLERPELVREIHDAYLQAGAQIITANTFGIPAGDEFEDAVRAGVEIATQAAQSSSAEIGVWASFAPQTVITQAGALNRCAEILPDALLLETCATKAETIQAVEILRECQPTVLAATFTVSEVGQLSDWTSLIRAASVAVRGGANIVGVNCVGRDIPIGYMMGVLKRGTGVPVIAQPSAGIPTQNDAGEWVYPWSASKWAFANCRLFWDNAAIVGGCCGTTPEYIAGLNIACTNYVETLLEEERFLQNL